MSRTFKQLYKEPWNISYKSLNISYMSIYIFIIHLLTRYVEIGAISPIWYRLSRTFFKNLKNSQSRATIFSRSVTILLVNYYIIHIIIILSGSRIGKFWLELLIAKSAGPRLRFQEPIKFFEFFKCSRNPKWVRIR